MHMTQTNARATRRLLGLALWASCSVHAQTVTQQVEVPLVGQKCNPHVLSVTHILGELRLPPPAGNTAADTPAAKATTPAVVIMHSNAGIIGVGRTYAQALNAAGIATLEIDSYSPRGIRSGNEAKAPTGCDRLSDAWGALAYLAKMPGIAPDNIGILGLSSGGLVALMAAQGLLAPGMIAPPNSSTPGAQFRGAFVLYPSWANVRHDPKLSWMRQVNVRRAPLSPPPAVTLVVGTEDDYEINATEDCNAVMDDLASRGHPTRLILLPGATHAFDWPHPPPPGFSRFAKAGQGSMLTMRYSERDSQQTRQEVRHFFERALRASP